MTSKLAHSTVQYSTVQHRLGKREEGEELVSKHQIRSGDRRWTGRRGVGPLKPRRENKMQGKSGEREGVKHEKVAERRKFSRVNEGGEVEQRGAAYDRAKG